jgi:hypothetical protein
MDFDYKKYSLEKLEEWVHDAMSSDASPHEIYSTIREVVRENYNYHREQVSRAYGLLELLSGHRPVADTDMEKAKQEYLESIHPDVPDDEPIVLQKKWIMPVEEVMDEDTYEINYAITFPQDLLDQTGWMEGDQLEWIDRDDGSFQLRKVNDD